MSNFKVIILGSSSATPTATRNPSAQYVTLFDRNFLIDCGEGTQNQIRTHKLKLQALDHIFISHLHGDHFFGLIGLLSSMHLLGREKSLSVYANEQLKAIIELQLNASQTQLRFELKWIFLTYESKVLLFEDKSIFIYSFPLNHRIPTCGFVITEKQKLLSLIKEKIIAYDIPINQIDAIKSGSDLVLPSGKIIPNNEITKPLAKAKSYAYCSDTLYDEMYIKYISEVDVLYHESTFAHDLLNRAEATFHTTALQAAQVAKLANVSQLIIGHFSARYGSVKHLLQEAQSVFPNTLDATDGMIINI